MYSIIAAAVHLKNLIDLRSKNRFQLRLPLGLLCTWNHLKNAAESKQKYYVEDRKLFPGKQTLEIRFVEFFLLNSFIS